MLIKLIWNRERDTHTLRERDRETEWLISPSAATHSVNDFHLLTNYEHTVSVTNCNGLSKTDEVTFTQCLITSEKLHLPHFIFLPEHTKTRLLVDLPTGNNMTDGSCYQSTRHVQKESTEHQKEGFILLNVSYYGDYHIQLYVCKYCL